MIPVLLLLAASPGPVRVQDAPQSAQDSDAKAPGRSMASAIKVGSVDEEYAWLRKHGFQPETQSLIVKGKKAYDQFELVDPATGERFEIWFDISSFYGKMF